MRLQPVHLQAEYDCSTFECGEPLLDTWLQESALHNEEHGGSRTFVLLDQQKVIAYYSLSTASMKRESLPGRLRRNQPDPVPLLLLGRLAVDKRYQGLGIGHRLYQDIVHRCLTVAEMAGVVALVVNAISEQAENFYLKLGFHEIQTMPTTHYLTIKEAKVTLPKG